MFAQSVLLLNRSILHLFLYNFFQDNIFILFFTVGIVNNECSFDEPNICGYNVSCREATRYLWKRGQKSTRSSSTGPYSDNTGKGNGCEWILFFLFININILFTLFFVYLCLMIHDENRTSSIQYKSSHHKLRHNNLTLFFNIWGTTEKFIGWPRFSHGIWSNKVCFSIFLPCVSHTSSIDVTVFVSHW